MVTTPRGDNDEKYSKHRDLLEEMTRLFDNTYLIDLFTYGPEYNAEFKEQMYLNYHMSSMGYVFTADMIASYIDYIIRNNPKEFEEVPLIGTKFTDKKNLK